MLTLYSYPVLFGVADNNGYGLKVFAFLKLAGVPFQHEHLFEASAAPRGQLPYINDNGMAVGDSDSILAHLTASRQLMIDAGLTANEQDENLLVSRLLDDLYWVMSFSRWKDERFWPAFRDALLAEHSSLDAAGLDKARQYNFQRYFAQGIGRFEPEAAYARGLDDLAFLARRVPPEGFVHGLRPTSADAAIYGFLANIHFSPIPTPLKLFLAAQPNLVRHCEAMHRTVMGPQPHP
jgi:glutathione S-transferase